MEKYISPEIEILEIEIEDIVTTSPGELEGYAFEAEEDTFGLFTK